MAWACVLVMSDCGTNEPKYHCANASQGSATPKETKLNFTAVFKFVCCHQKIAARIAMTAESTYFFRNSESRKAKVVSKKSGVSMPSGIALERSKAKIAAVITAHLSE